MSPSSPSEFYAVIPAGGSGTRLWPLSRSQEPKFLLDLLGTGKSLLVETIERLAPFADERHVYVVTGDAHVPAVVKQAPSIPETQVLSEPSPKNSAAAVGLAAYVLNLVNPDAVVGFFAADHVIHEEAAFREVLGSAINAAESGHLVTIGITPHEPASAFGYIRKDAAFSSDGVHHVGEFVEKPSYVDAQRFLASGDYLWNAGIFVGKVSTVVAAFDDFAADLGTPLRDIAASVAAGEDFRHIWDTLPAIAFDYAVAEPAAKAGRFLVVPGTFGWQDVGDFASLAGARSNGSGSDVIVVGDSTKVHPNNSTGIVVGSSGRIITVLGMTDVVSVDTPDALLVTTKDHAQDVKQIVESMKEQGLEGIL